MIQQLLFTTFLTLPLLRLSGSENTPGAPVSDTAPAAPAVSVEPISGENWEATVDTSQAEDLKPWVREKLLPVIKEWYPKLVQMLPSTDFKAPQSFHITFDKNYSGVAYAMGNKIVCNPAWYRKELKREALGSLVHEMVHVVQQYRKRVPGWLQEGIPDYIRWYLYEPQSRGCEIPASQADKARHDASYRTSANFLNYVITKSGKPEFLQKLNASLREGNYSEQIWAESGRSLTDWAESWKAALKTPPVEPKTEKK